MARIGIPRALAYYLYYPFWKVFFEALGHEVVESSSTNRAIMEMGIKDAVSDACIPIKIFHGHVADLNDKVDYIFVPRLISMRKYGNFGTETLCPKFLGLPDMLTASISNLAPILEARMDLKKGKLELFKVYRDLGKRLGANYLTSCQAFHQASKVQKKYERLLQSGVLPDLAMQEVLRGSIPEKDEKRRQLKKSKVVNPRPGAEPDKPGRLLGENPCCLGVVGYPYTIYDPYINVGLLSALSKDGVKVLTQDMLSLRQLESQASKVEKDLFWYFSNRVIQGALYFMDVEPVDGIVHITAFACGPDSIVDKYLEIEAKKRKMPYMAITIDEHTGEAGVRTRLEAFLDILEYRRGRRES